MEAEDEGRSSIAQDILRQSTDFLTRNIAPNDGVGGPHCHCFRLKTIFGGSHPGMEGAGRSTDGAVCWTPSVASGLGDTLLTTVVVQPLLVTKEASSPNKNCITIVLL